LPWISPNVRKHYVSYIRVRKYFIIAFMNMNILTLLSTLLYLSLIMILDNYSWVETAKSKIPLFIVASSTVLTEHEIFNPKKWIIKVAISKL